jgi:UDP-N-acetylmuramate: L-alanyl-gamma-D-glutamyl-meso-diaminopimelate ligase
MNVHFIAIGGSAMHSLALALATRAGVVVTGSDDAIFEPSRSRLQSAGLLPAEEGWFPERIHAGLDAVVLGMHARSDNPELQRAQELGIPVYSYPEHVQKACEAQTRVVVGGSHGKTTTTSMLLHVLKYLDRLPDYLVGAQVPGLDASVRLQGTDEWAVFEGDEYLASPLDPRPKFHLYKAHVGLITGMAWDHVNVFPTQESYADAFRGFLASMEPGGTLLYFEEDAELAALVAADASPIRKIPYRTPEHRHDGTQWYWKTPMGELPMSVMGRHNLANAEGARWLAQEMGIQEADFYEAIASFQGAQRRLEPLADSERRAVYLDFAHAPSKVAATTAAFAESFGNRPVWGLLELHTFSSLNPAFLPGYAGSLDGLDRAMVLFDPAAVAHKKLPPLAPEAVQAAFGPGVEVFTDSDALRAELERSAPDQLNLLIMSSGNLGGWDVRQWAPQFV